MNAFMPIRHAAANDSLPQDLQHLRDWLRSEEFAERTDLRGEHGAETALRISLYLLDRLALDPRRAPETMAFLGDGIIQLDYFGVANPVPILRLELGSTQLETLKKAVEANIAGPRYRKALHTLHQREPRAVRRREDWVSRLVDEKRSAMDWPTAEDFRANPSRARERQDVLVQALVQEGKRVWAHRHARLARLDPHQDLGGWTELLYDIVRRDLAPEHEELAEAEALAAPRC